MTVTVYNVKQGDSFFIYNKYCMSNVYPLLIDSGCKGQLVYKRIMKPENELAVLITHAHRDHMGGLLDIIAHCNVTKVFFPCYLPEILYINTILNQEFVHYPHIPIPKLNSIGVYLLSSGDSVFDTGCDNFKVLNPPRGINEIFSGLFPEAGEGGDIQTVLARLGELGIEINVSDIYDYAPEIVPEQDPEEYPVQAREFIINFFRYMSVFITTATSKNIRAKIRNHLKVVSNHTSIVFRYCCDNNQENSWLFTGDADIKAFERIINGQYRSYLKNNILKVPHHGSKENLNRNILMEIDPQVAVISHNNLKLTNPDPHPNQVVINLLKNHGVRTYYTNDVEKPKSKKAFKKIPANYSGFSKLFNIA